MLISSCYVGVYDSDVSITMDESAPLNSTGRMSISKVVSDGVKSYYKEDRKPENIDVANVKKYTPKVFVLQIDKFCLYNRTPDGFDTQEVQNYITDPETNCNIPQNFDLVYSDNIYKGIKAKGKIYDGLSLSLLPHALGFTSGDLRTNSIVGLDIPESDIPKNTIIKGEITERVFQVYPSLKDIDTYKNLRFFDFNELQPLDTKTGFLSYLTIGKDIEDFDIQNPEGIFGEWINPLTYTKGNSVGLYLKSDNPIVLEGFENPEIVFKWEMEDLIEIYPSTNTIGGYVATFALDDPFPVSIIVNESNSSGGTSSSNPPKEVLFGYVGKLATTNKNALQWVMPNDKGFDHVKVTRMQSNTPLTDKSQFADGVVVYDGSEVCFVDNVIGDDYYYLIQSVGHNQMISNGVIVNHKDPV